MIRRTYQGFFEHRDAQIVKSYIREIDSPQTMAVDTLPQAIAVLAEHVTFWAHRNGGLPEPLPFEERPENGSTAPVEVPYEPQT